MARPWALLQLSDLHIGARWDERCDPVSDLRAAVDSALALLGRPDAVLVSGDIANGDDWGPEYALASQLLAPLGAPLYLIPGNHDDRGLMRRHWTLPGSGEEPIQHGAELGPLRLVAVDSVAPGHPGGELDAARLSWLDATLGTSPDRPTILALHHPPARSGVPAWDAIGQSGQGLGGLAEVVARHPQVQLITAGHIHRAMTTTFAGRPLLTIPSTCRQIGLDFEASELAIVDEPPMYAVHTVVDGRVVSHLQPVRAGR
jgi:Icc protein